MRARLAPATVRAQLVDGVRRPKLCHGLHGPGGTGLPHPGSTRKPTAPEPARTYKGGLHRRGDTAPFPLLPLRRPARKSPCSDLPCRWRCHEVTVGSFRYLVRPHPEPPSACGISPRRAGGEGKWGLRAGLLRGRCRRQRGRAPRSAEVSAGLPLSRCATAPPRGERFPTSSPAERGWGDAAGRGGAPIAGGYRTLPSSPPAGEMPQAEGESAAVSGGRRGPPPQSLRDSSPAGGRFPTSSPAKRGVRCCRQRGGLPSPGGYRTLPTSPPAGEMPRAEGESAAVSGGQRGPPPQSLRDSSTARGAISDLFPRGAGGEEEPNAMTFSAAC